MGSQDPKDEVNKLREGDKVEFLDGLLTTRKEVSD